MALSAAQEVFSIMLLLSHRDLTYHMISGLLSHFAATQAAEKTDKYFSRWTQINGAYFEASSKIELRTCSIESRLQCALKYIYEIYMYDIYIWKREERLIINSKFMLKRKRSSLPPSSLTAFYLRSLLTHTHTHSTHTPPLAYISRQQLSWPPPPCILSFIKHTKAVFAALKYMWICLLIS